MKVTVSLNCGCHLTTPDIKPGDGCISVALGNCRVTPCISHVSRYAFILAAGIGSGTIIGFKVEP